MEPLSLEVPLSDEKSGKRRRGRRRRRRGSGGRNGAPSNKSPAGDTQAVNRAINRFKQNPLPMGIPAEIDPPPKKIDVTWKTKAVSKDIKEVATTMEIKEATNKVAAIIKADFNPNNNNNLVNSTVLDRSTSNSMKSMISDNRAMM